MPRSTTATEHLPAIDLQVLAQFFDIGNQVPGGVVHQIGVWGGTAGAALVEQDDAVLGRVVELAHLVAAAAARTTVQHHHRLAVRVAALFEVQRVAVVDLQGADVLQGDALPGQENPHSRPVAGRG
ncbi:hypothetical protein G6F65_018886 [Rhizopus arrhizus]|nr:hypothetical protein G6F65_018886 [Rhizopus arrhizus]